MTHRNCTICGKPIILIPSAEQRAAKDVTGKSAEYYRNLFTEHSTCTLFKRAEETANLVRKLSSDRFPHFRALKGA